MKLFIVKSKINWAQECKEEEEEKLIHFMMCGS